MLSYIKYTAKEVKEANPVKSDEWGYLFIPKFIIGLFF